MSGWRLGIVWAWRLAGPPAFAIVAARSAGWIGFAATALLLIGSALAWGIFHDPADR